MKRNVTFRVLMHQTSKNANNATSETQQPPFSVRTGQARILMPYPSRFDLLPKLESVENGLRKQFLVPEKFKAHIYIQDANKQFYFIPNEETWQKTLQAELLLSGSEVINLLVSPKHRFRPENHTNLNFDAFDFLQCDTLRLPIPTDSAVREAGTEMQPVNSEAIYAMPPNYPEVIANDVIPTEPVSYEANLTAAKFQGVNESQLAQPTVVDFSVTGNQMWTTNANDMPQNFALHDSNMNGNVQHLPELSHVGGETNFANGNPSVYGSGTMVDQEYPTEKPLEFVDNGHSESLVPTCVQSDNIFPIEATQANAYVQDNSICVISEENHLNAGIETPELPVLHGDVMSSLDQQPCNETRENGELKVLKTLEQPTPDIVEKLSSSLECILEKWVKSFDEKLQNNLKNFKSELEEKITSMVKERVTEKVESAFCEMKTWVTKTVSEALLTDQAAIKSDLSKLIGCMKDEMANQIAAGLEEARINQRESIDSRFDFIVLSLRKDRDSYKAEIGGVRSDISDLKASQLSKCSLLKETGPGIANKGDIAVNGTNVTHNEICLNKTSEEPLDTGLIQVENESLARNVGSTNGNDSTACEGVKRKISTGAIEKDLDDGAFTPVKSKIVACPKTPAAPTATLSDDIITRKKARLLEGGRELKNEKEGTEVGTRKDTASNHSSASSSGSDKKSIGARRKLFSSPAKEGDN